jgi:hypothetical protein
MSTNSSGDDGGVLAALDHHQHLRNLLGDSEVAHVLDQNSQLDGRA